MRTLLAFATLLTITATASAHGPQAPHVHAGNGQPARGHHGPVYHARAPFTLPVGYRPEPIPPLGNNLPLSYRARYNRPSYLAGKIAYHIAPSSQEAMSWHENVHRGSYRNHAGRIEPTYMHPKPWEILTVGPRTTLKPIPLDDSPGNEPMDAGY